MKKKRINGSTKEAAKDDNSEINKESKKELEHNSEKNQENEAQNNNEQEKNIQNNEEKDVKKTKKEETKENNEIIEDIDKDAKEENKPNEIKPRKKTSTAKSNKNKKRKRSKKYTICGISIGRLLDYFFLYSIIGFFIETIFGLVVYGVLESRQSFLYGPFCSIYGLGAVIMIPALQKFKKNNFTLFAGGFLVGSLVEYIISFLGELIFHMKWWDYSNMAFNINGRICIAYSFFWGILAIILMTYINPKIDKIIDKIPLRYFRTVTIIGIIILFLDAMITGLALKMFFVRLINNYDLNLENQSQIIQELNGDYDNEIMKYLDEKVFTDEKIIKTFPNLKLIDKDNNIIWLKDIYKDIQPYYIRVFTPRANTPAG